MTGSVTVSSACDSSTADQTLVELLARCAQADETALAAFYALTSRWIYALVLRRVGRQVAADSVMVGIYHKVWRRAADFAGGGRSPLSWTTSIAFETMREQVG